MKITRRESLTLFGWSLAATAAPLHADLPNSMPTEKTLDRARLLQLLGTVSEKAPPLVAQRIERTDLGRTDLGDAGRCMPLRRCQLLERHLPMCQDGGWGAIGA